MADAVAYARYARTSSLKVDLVLKAIRGKNAAKAVTTLELAPKRASVLVSKTLQSAVANLGGKLGRKIELNEAWIKSCSVDQAPPLKRMRAGSMGRAFPFKRKLCHLTVQVTDLK